LPEGLSAQYSIGGIMDRPRHRDCGAFTPPPRRGGVGLVLVVLVVVIAVQAGHGDLTAITARLSAVSAVFGAIGVTQSKHRPADS
jgi:hypothetical protein